MQTFPLLLLAAVSADPFGGAAGIEVTYTGRLAPVAVAEGTADDKGFKATWFLPAPADAGAAESLFLIDEDSAAQPWPARFGFSPPAGGEGGPRIGYRFADRDHTVPLPGLQFPHVDRLTAEREIVAGPRRYTVVAAKTVAGRDCFVVESSTNFGREQTISVEKPSGLVVSHDETVFLGRGDRFRLTLELSSVTPLDAAQTDARRRLADHLRTIAEATRERDPALDLPMGVRETVASVAAPLADSAKGTPFESLAASIGRSVAEQQTRAAGIEGLAGKIVGSPAPAFALKDLQGRAIDPETLKGKTLVLHFWDYDNDALTAPYGQVGYLDFLHRRRRTEGVEVIGVAVNAGFSDAAARGRPARSAQNLARFMNLDYRLATDDGTLLRSFGDPRPLGAPLPLWVVIGPDNVVRSYRTGLFEMEPNEGLKELDAIVVNLAKKP